MFEITSESKGVGKASYNQLNASAVIVLLTVPAWQFCCGSCVVPTFREIATHLFLSYLTYLFALHCFPFGFTEVCASTIFEAYYYENMPMRYMEIFSAVTNSRACSSTKGDFLRYILNTFSIHKVSSLKFAYYKHSICR